MGRTKSPLFPWMIAVGAFLVGSWVGGLPLRSTIRQLRVDLDERQVAECTDDSVGREIASVFQGRPWEAGLNGPSPFERVDEPDEPEEPDEAGEVDEGEDEGDDDAIEWNFDFGDGDEAPEPEDLEEALEMAREAMDIRAAQAWAALDDQAALDDDQLAAFQGAIDQMNDELMASADELIQTVTSGGEPTRREALVFADNILDTILETDDAIYGILDAEQRSAVEDEVLDPLAYVEPSLVDKLMELDQ